MFNVSSPSHPATPNPLSNRRSIVTEPDMPDTYNDFTTEEQDYADQIMRNDQAIDELVAAKWRNNYLAAQADGKIVKKVPPPPGGAKGEERPKGPKLGGSRSARAQMRLQEEKAAAAKKR